MKYKKLKEILSNLDDNEEINFKFISKIHNETQNPIRIEKNVIIIQMELSDIENLYFSIGNK